MTIAELLARWPQQMLGRLSGHSKRFPLLLKLLDVKQPLSVQVHPSAANAPLIPKGETAKTEAWVVLQGGPQARYLRRSEVVRKPRESMAGDPGRYGG